MLMAPSAIPATADPVPKMQIVAGGTTSGTFSAAGSVAAAVPELYSFLLFGCALIGLGLWGRRGRTTMNVAGGSK